MALVEYDVRDHIATIRLNRPERLNATSPELHEELVAAFADFVENDDAWVAILTGTGRAFCAGRDIKIQAETGAAPTPEYTRLWNLFGIADTDKPLITAINGYAIGAGWYMVIGSDIRIAAESATFGMGEIPTGVLGPYWLGSTEGIPWALNTEFTLLGEHVSARRLLEAGMLNEVVPDDQLMETAERWARKFHCPAAAARAQDEGADARDAPAAGCPDDGPRAGGTGVPEPAAGHDRGGAGVRGEARSAVPRRLARDARSARRKAGERWTTPRLVTT